MGVEAAKNRFRKIVVGIGFIYVGYGCGSASFARR